MWLLKANRKRQLDQEIKEIRNNPAYSNYFPEDFPDTKQQDQVLTQCENKYIKHLQYLKSKGVDNNTIEMLEKAYAHFCLCIATKKKKLKGTRNGGMKERANAPSSDDLASSGYGSANLEYSNPLSDQSGIADCQQSNNQMDSDASTCLSFQSLVYLWQSNLYCWMQCWALSLHPHYACTTVEPVQISCHSHYCRTLGESTWNQIVCTNQHCWVVPSSFHDNK